MEILQVGVLGVAGVLIALQFRSEKPEYGFYISFAIGIVVFGLVVNELTGLLGTVSLFQQYLATGNTYFTILLKVVGITYICEFCAAVCKDAGYGTVAGQIEIFGKLAVLMAGMPILLAIVENINAIAL